MSVMRKDQLLQQFAVAYEQLIEAATSAAERGDNSAGDGWDREQSWPIWLAGKSWPACEFPGSRPAWRRWSLPTRRSRRS